MNITAYVLPSVLLRVQLYIFRHYYLLFASFKPWKSAWLELRANLSISEAFPLFVFSQTERHFGNNGVIIGHRLSRKNPAFAFCCRNNLHNLFAGTESINQLKFTPFPVAFNHAGALIEGWCRKPMTLHSGAVLGGYQILTAKHLVTQEGSKER